MFHAVILGSPLDEEGERILDQMEEGQDWLTSERAGAVRRYDFGLRFDSAEDAIDWLEAQALTCNAEADRHVEFGTPGRNAP